MILVDFVLFPLKLRIVDPTHVFELQPSVYVIKYVKQMCIKNDRNPLNMMCVPQALVALPGRGQEALDSSPVGSRQEKP